MDDDGVCIVGGGPAGMVAGLLFARAGVRTTVLEKHGDFLRDFRGDTVHPSTIAIFDELGLGDALLARPHDAVTTLTARVAGRDYVIADMSRLPVRHPLMAMMPQWEFLDFVQEQARRLPAFSLRLNSEADGLVREGGRVCGVTVAGQAAVRARLVIAADGRRSVLRERAALPLRDLGAPIDVFWFRVPKDRAEKNRTGGTFDRGRIVVTIDRGDYWQVAWVFAKGGADAIRARGLQVFRSEVTEIAPELAGHIGAVASWDDVKLLTVALDRLTRWHAPGLLAIGDAAHAMSPVGGVGVNLAVQDAVAAANILAAPLARGEDPDPLLGRVQQRRMLPTRAIQGLQRAIHRNVIGKVLAGGDVKAPLAIRLLDAVPPLRRVPAQVLGLGIRREHVRSPVAP